MLQNSEVEVDELQKCMDESGNNYQNQAKCCDVDEQKLSERCIREAFNIISQNNQEKNIEATGASLSNLSKDLSDSLPQISSTKSQSKPLQVMVNVNCSQESLPGSILASSPADSIDSGVSCLGSMHSSPSTSPTSSPTHTPKNSFSRSEVNGLQQQIFLRQRSTSESCGVVGIKGILKKTAPIIEHRGRFTRSLSECQHDLQIKTKDNEKGPCNGVAVDGCESALQKKHVSFSDRLVQKYSFRPNSSILGQKKKNQRKSKNKLKKRLSEESSCDEDRSSSGEQSQEEQAIEHHPEEERVKPCRIRKTRILRSSIGEESLVVFESASVDSVAEECRLPLAEKVL